MFKICVLILMIFSLNLIGGETEKVSFEGKDVILFTLKNDQSRFFFLSKEFKKTDKKYFFVTFFTNSCKNCPKEREILKQMAAKYNDLKVIYIAIREGEEDISKFQEQAKKTMQNEGLDHVLLDVFNSVSKSYYVEDVPRLLIIDTATKKIVKDLTGYERNLENIYLDLNKSQK